MTNFSYFDSALQQQLQAMVDDKTKPLGSLGELETLAVQVGLIQNTTQPAVDKPNAFIFAADHGVCAEGVNPFPQAVTEQMLANFSAGGAAMSVFCRSNDIALNIINMGIVNEQARWSNVQHHAIAAGTANMAVSPAMTAEQCEQAMQVGQQLAEQAQAEGANLLIIGEMGIGNTTSASAILAALAKQPASDVVGPGTGANSEQQQLKANVIEQALARFSERDARTVLQQVGGFEIAAMVGMLLAGKTLNIPVVVDGFIATAAALVANGIDADANHFWLFAHESAEPAHQLMLKTLAAKPLIQLGLRLGEGSGGALSYPLIKCAIDMLNQMATFSQAGVSEQ